MKKNLTLTVIVAVAVLLGLTMAVMYYSAQNIIQDTMLNLVEREMSSIKLRIRNRLAKVEETLDNMAWVVTDNLDSPDALSALTYKIVLHNPDIKGSGIPCVPDLFPDQGYWYEPFSARRADGSIETWQLGSAKHDYTKSEFFTAPIAKGEGDWCEPYLDSDGSQAIVTTYGVPVRDSSGKIAATVVADIPLAWLDAILDESRVYRSTQHFIVTGAGHLLAGEDGKLLQAVLKLMDVSAGQEGYATLDPESVNSPELTGKQHLFYHPVGGKTDWMLISVLSDDEVFGQLRSVRLTLLLLVIAALILLTFLVLRTKHSLDRLQWANAGQEREDGEVQVLRKIQLSLLPKKELKIRTGKDDPTLEVKGTLLPATEAGGNLFDYFIRDEQLYFCIGDINAAGVDAALLMAAVQTMFRDCAALDSAPSRLMQHLNTICCQSNPAKNAVTMFIGVLDLRTGLLRCCNAGHDSPLLMHNAQCKTLDFPPNQPLGEQTELTYTAQEAQLEPQSTVFLYTYGLTQAQNNRREQFGLERVRKTLSTGDGQSPQELLEKVTDAVHSFMRDAEQRADLTMLAIRYTPKEP